MDALTHDLQKSFERRLLKDHLLTASQLEDAIRSAEQAGIPLLDHLVTCEQINPLALASAAAETYGLPLADLEHVATEDLPAPGQFPEALLREHNLLPLAYDGYWLQLAMSSPSCLMHVAQLELVTGHGIAPCLAPMDRLRARLDEWLSNDAAQPTTDASIAEALDSLARHAIDGELNDLSSNLVDHQDDAPVVKFVNSILRDAVRREASDIHFESFEDSYRVRMRIDGMLHEIAQPPSALQARIASRLKVMAELDIAERRLPQDGTIKVNVSDVQPVDFRVSTLPTINGEKIVLRLLDSVANHMHIDELGLADDQQQWLNEALARPQGMILVTGPTGSGKTVTLYSGIRRLNLVERNICTAEDPVEIKVAGINQLNVQPRIGLDFAQALRAFLRQDPDVVMVGEIRDRETAEIAIKAAQTGHLVLSSLHTNSAADTLSRLSNMGVAPFNVASAISLIIAQRLARRLCPHCRQPAEIPHDALAEAGIDNSRLGEAVLYEPHGCPRCRDGYRGRVGLFEVVPVSPRMRKCILEHASTAEMDDLTRSEGHRNLWQSGLDLVLAGITSLSELYRVAQPSTSRGNSVTGGGQ